VLCEKPLALNFAEARRMVAASRSSGRIAMVNFSYRNWSAIHGAADAVRRGRIGRIRHVEASYLQSWLISRAWGDWRRLPEWLWRLSSRHGSQGVLGDIGVHIVDFVTYPAGPLRRVYCHLRTFPKAPSGRIGEFVLDANDSAVMTVEFENGAIGTIHTTRWSGGHTNRLHLKISGTLGALEIDSERSRTSYRICSGRDLHRAQWKEVSCPAVGTNDDRFVEAIKRRARPQPDFARGAQVQKVLDACFKSHALGRPVIIGR
jgi:predicted dehydrogenase